MSFDELSFYKLSFNEMSFDKLSLDESSYLILFEAVLPFQLVEKRSQIDGESQTLDLEVSLHTLNPGP